MINQAHGCVIRPGAIMTVAVALMAIGVFMVASTTVAIDRPVFGENLLRSTPIRQLVFGAVGIGILFVVMRAAPRVLASPVVRRRCTYVFYGLTVACLLAALLPGFSEAHRGSDRWVRISVGGTSFGFQPSELAKLAMVALVASILTERRADPRLFRRCFIPASVVIGVCVLLVGKEDFGTAALLAAVGGAMLLVGGCRLRHIALVVGVGSISLAGLLFAEPYRVERLTAFKDVTADPQGAGYQPLQSLATIASGGWFGTGLGAGIQKYGYLPESHTDFVFAAICEEMGLLGAVLVIALYCVFVYLGLRVMMTARSRFERLLAFGLTLTIGLQVAMNVAVVTVVAPTTGISLPLISAGGSGIMVVCVAIGTLCAIAVRAGQEAPQAVGVSTEEDT